MNKIFLYVFIMAAVTYCVRMLPFTLFRKKITSVFVRSFLHYIPYAVLSAMIIPDVFFSVGKETNIDIIAAAAGFLAALVMSYLEKSLLTVALCACTAAFLILMF